MKKNNLIFIIIGGLILLGLGYGFGLSLGQKGIEKTETPLDSLLESKIIGKLGAVASGEITAISDRNLTLSKEGDSLTISIREDALIYRLVSLKEEIKGVLQSVEKEEVEFSQIKIGDQVEVSCELKADGSLEGKIVIISPII